MMIIILTALLSSLFTLALLGIVFKFWLGPLLDEHMQQRSEEMAVRIRKRIVEDFHEVSREIVRGSARNVARTGADLVEGALNKITKGGEPMKSRRGRSENND